MSEAANRKDLASRPRVRRVDIPPKPTRRDAGCRFSIGSKNGRPAKRSRRLFRLSHQLQRRLLQRKVTRPSRQPIQQSLRKQRHIPRRREHSRMSRNSPHSPSRRIVHRAAKKMIKVRIGRSRSLVVIRRWSDLRNPLFAWQIPRVLHPQRPEDMFLRIHFQRSAANLLYQSPKSDEVDVGVFELCARHRVQRRIHRSSNTLGLIRRGKSPRILQTYILRQSGVVRQQLTNRHTLLSVQPQTLEDTSPQDRRTAAYAASYSCMIAVAVTRHFVSDAMSKIVSSVIGSTAGSRARSP